MNKSLNLKQETHSLKTSGIGLLISLVMLLILTAGTTTLIMNGTITEKQAQIVQPMIHAVSVAIGSVIALGKGCSNKVLTLAIMTVGYVLFWGLINIAVFRSDINSIMQGMIAICVGAMVVYILKIMMDKRRQNRYRLKKW